MPEEGVSKRLGQRPGDWVNRWYYRNRSKIAVVTAFAVACLIGLAAASLGIETLGASSANAAAPAP